MALEITLLEPFFTGSHRSWAQGYAAASRHNIEILSLPGRYWKWRMHGGAITLARRFNERKRDPDIVLATDMLDLNIFLGLTRWSGPVGLYFHENQLSYPWSPSDPDEAQKRDRHFQFINIASALAADRLYFNSAYHMNSFLGAIPAFLKVMPDHRHPEIVAELREKSQVLALGMDLSQLDAQQTAPEPDQPPLLLWNHRWEYDKNPDLFFNTLFEVDQPYRLAVLGQHHRNSPPIFEEAQTRLAEQIVHWGFAASKADYAAWLWRADLLPVTSHQDFFGGSVVEAIYCNTAPLLPRRLAYPEHVDDPRCFYDSDENFADALRQALASPNPNRYQEQVRAYDWSQQAPIYDDAQNTLALLTR